MIYVKNILSGIAGIVLALIGPGLAHALRGISTEKATGLGAVAGGLTETLFSPLFWVLAVLLTLAFWAASHINNKALRVLLFWVPTLFVLIVGMMVTALFGYLSLHLPRS